MNEHWKGLKMDPQEIVAKLSAEYSRAEKHLRLAGVALNRMPGLYDQIHKAGSIGYLETLKRSATAQVNAGLVANAAFGVANAHISDTERANDLGIDIPVVRSGPGR